MRFKTLLSLLPLLLVTACAETQFVTHMGKVWGGDPYASQSQVNPNIPYKVGKPYQIDGRWYYPQENWTYIEEGQASWYGDEFQGRSTANGETFDKYALTAAHRTLPMPSLVRVTNLENNRMAILRVNDRGPFRKERIIDVSHEAARALGFDMKGTARVRVELLSEESKRLAMAHGAQLPDVNNYASYNSPGNNGQIAFNSPPPSEGSVSGSGMPFGSGGSFGNGPIETVDLTPPNMPLMGGGGGYAPPPPPMENLAFQPGLIAPAGASEPPPAAVSTQMPSFPPIQQQDSLTNGVYLQVGAFADRQNVERLVGRLKELAEVEVSPLERGGRMLYRVRLGPLNTIQQAEMLQSRVAQFGITDAKIIIP